MTLINSYQFVQITFTCKVCIKLSKMKIITSLLIVLFYVQYYITLIFIIMINTAKKLCSCIVNIKSKDKIHPYHNAPQGVFMWMEEFIKMEGFCFEEYRLRTEDNAEVHLWRIRKQKIQSEKPYPVFILHGLLESSSTWFLTSEKSNCLPYLLAQQGYDVWIGNNRGNRISQKQEESYHNYTIDHLVQYDQPTIIKGILSITMKEKIFYIGHSQGSTQLLLALDVHSELRDKIAVFIGLGTVVSLSGVKQNFILNILAKSYLIEILNFLGFTKLLLLSQCFSQALGIMIYNSSIHTRVIMTGIKKLIGINKGNIPENMIGVIFTHEPGGASVNNVLHWIQCFRNKKKFHRFCYGAKKNLEIYGSKDSPEYCFKYLKDVPFNSYIFRGEKDALVSHQDFTDLISLFPSQKITAFSLKDYNHLDYLWGEKVHEDIYNEILRIIKSNS